MQLAFRNLEYKRDWDNARRREASCCYRNRNLIRKCTFYGLLLAVLVPSLVLLVIGSTSDRSKQCEQPLDTWLVMTVLVTVPTLVLAYGIAAGIPDPFGGSNPLYRCALGKGASMGLYW